MQSLVLVCLPCICFPLAEIISDHADDAEAVWGVRDLLKGTSALNGEGKDFFFSPLANPAHIFSWTADLKLTSRFSYLQATAEAIRMHKLLTRSSKTSHVILIFLHLLPIKFQKTQSSRVHLWSSTLLINSILSVKYQLNTHLFGSTFILVVTLFCIIFSMYVFCQAHWILARTQLLQIK